MTWMDFDNDSALERDILERALPLAGEAGHVFMVDAAQQSVAVNIRFTGTLGPTPEKCVDLLQIRPLLTGAAWKLVDLLVEYALDEAGYQPSRGRRWSIEEKVKASRTGISKPPHISLDTWSALLATYAATDEHRHSLVHRRTYIDQTHALVGVDRSGGSLRPLSAEEQEAFGRAALRASATVTGNAADTRVDRDLLRQLRRLQALHNVRLRPTGPATAIHEIRFTIDPAADDSGHYVLDIAWLRQRLAPNHVEEADLIVLLRDRPGQELRGRLEDVPNEAVNVDPDRPPLWLS
jgi:hypothetical protein